MDPDMTKIPTAVLRHNHLQMRGTTGKADVLKKTLPGAESPPFESLSDKFTVIQQTIYRRYRWRLFENRQGKKIEATVHIGYPRGGSAYFRTFSTTTCYAQAYAEAP